MSSEQTIKCPICGEPYLFFNYYCGDQSACPICREKTGSTGGKTVRCSICGEPYEVFMHYAGDQSACENCRAKARNK